MSFERREADGIENVAPPEMQELVGHADAFAGLEAAFDAGRMPSAVLLHGPRGVGKATFAFTVVRMVLARSGDEPFDRVAAQVSAMSHPNLSVLRKARDPSNAERFYTAIRVDDVRAARDALHQTRGRSGYRICVIDSVDDCNVSSANALLKTLEEPPAQTVFIVISHRPGGLLPTIRSRCQTLGLRRLSDNDVATVLRRARPELPDSDVARATELAKGRPRRAFETLMLAEGDVLDALVTWLAAPAHQPTRAQLTIAEALAAAKGAELAFAQDMVRDWIAAQAENAARAGARFHLASANALWDKANALFADADIYNLDRRQTLVAVFDLIRDHARKTIPVS
ncbi:AAA family ATPase [Pelagibacterium halotolerans]|uniref:AAA family ATPase n=1 Tax=Pelagibacterium halotolerans TaxID=531813 RepID=UPI00384F6855